MKINKIDSIISSVSFLLLSYFIVTPTWAEFTPPTNLSNSPGVTSNQWIAADALDKDIYTVWEENGEIFFSCSGDGGSTFGSPFQLSSGEGTNFNPRVAVNPNQAGGVTMK